MPNAVHIVHQRATRRGAFCVAVTALGVTAVTGCAVNPEVDHSPSIPAASQQHGALPGGFVALDDSSASAEYRATIDAIPEPLPAGVDYPEGLPADFLPTDGYLQQGAARNQAWFTWLCAWETAYLDAEKSGDAAVMADSAAMVEHWPEMDFYQNVIVDPDHGWVANVVTPLVRGDSSGLQTDAASQCQQFPTVSAAEE